MIEKFILDYSRDNFDEKIVEVGKWKGYRVFDRDIEESTDCPLAIGLPLVLLVKGTECHVSTPEEAFEYLDSEIENN